MAPPVSRRPGFSRRAQFSLFFGYLIAILALLLAALLLVTAHFDPQGNNALRSILGDITAPFSSSSRAVVRGANGVGEGVLAYVEAGSKNRALAAEVRANRTKLIDGQNAKLENIKLRALLKIAQAEPGQAIAAHLVSTMGETSRRYAMIDKGSIHGVAVGEPVRAADGLIGQIVQTGVISARVLLISDTGNIVPVRRISDGMTAFARGLGDGSLSVVPIVPGAAPMARGDVFVTSGAGGVYPPGVPVCVIVTRDHDGAVGRPLADPGEAGFALIEKPFVAPPPAPTEIKAKPKRRKAAAE